jgi:hypothetical protein
MHRISCHTLFDITQTGVLNRSKPSEDNVEDWIKRRNTQCNFDTILQVISLRSQPEVVKLPIQIPTNEMLYEMFGFLYTQENTSCWKFEFEVQHSSVFENGIVSLGSLYKDCEGVPMIVCETQHSMSTKFLDITPELRNIYFEVL